MEPCRYSRTILSGDLVIAVEDLYSDDVEGMTSIRKRMKYLIEQ
ncbi:hypothetical protein [Frisingicoccus sp.]